MPEIKLADRQISLPPGSNLLDGLLAAGAQVPYSCRSGHCQTCLLQNHQALADDDPACCNLSPEQRAAGWLLACQCQVTQDLDLHPFDPRHSAVPALITGQTRLADDVLELRLRPRGLLRYFAGQHATLWLDEHLGRSYSIASLPDQGELHFHVRLYPHGAFSQRIQRMDNGQTIYLSNVAGNCHYDPDWHDRPLLLLARGTAVGMLQAIARDALKQGHSAGITLIVWQRSEDSGYWQQSLQSWANQHPTVTYLTTTDAEGDRLLRRRGLVARNTMALVCGSPAFVERQRKPLFMNGLARRQILDEAFLGSQTAAVDPNHG
ncbi:2Fe-2S iron-sulfur cluster-binding protein [Halopseudomonas salegens]|uniref:NAD(P)H-flavin reductase n=1 Tax=Halopseudomonas salegens TaxID=1434072 RepID=A0A1H2FWL1_9GAMM|nr:2Fe-2S iron-sulfur cluster-binding protein [Halopseudomonas salegens]SDU11709.1 NAD(P)H-flavin reductase [Halopseudomonas salegens]